MSPSVSVPRISASGPQLARKALEVARGFANAGLREATGHNDGAQIDKIESFFGLQGEAYCAMGAAYCYVKAYAFLTGQPTDKPTLKAILAHDIPRYFDPSPSCQAIVADAKQRGIWQPFAHAGAIQPGDLVLFCFAHGEPRHAEHVGICERAAGDQITCVEFNTSAGAGSNQADGQGCFVRRRNVGVVLGSVQINRPQKL